MKNLDARDQELKVKITMRETELFDRLALEAGIKRTTLLYKVIQEYIAKHG